MKKQSLILAVTATLALGLGSCTVTAEPTLLVATDYYSPMYHDGYIVFFDARGLPYYFFGGKVVWIPAGHRYYRRYTAYYKRHRVSYQRWYRARGHRYRRYRRASRRGARARSRRGARSRGPRTLREWDKANRGGRGRGGGRSRRR